jgi:hypothetical protein
MQFLTGAEVLAQQKQREPYWTIGLDLGQAADFSALAVLRSYADGGEKHHECGHLERFKLGTPYPAQVDAVVSLTRRPEFGDEWTLVPDATGVGRPVIDLFKAVLPKSRVKPVTITAGTSVNSSHYGLHVPKRDLVMTLCVLLETGRIEFAADLGDLERLIAEVQAFRVKITDAGNDTYGAWREGAHDDLVLALALAAWHAERKGQRRAVHSFQG